MKNLKVKLILLFLFGIFLLCSNANAFTIDSSILSMDSVTLSHVSVSKNKTDYENEQRNNNLLLSEPYNATGGFGVVLGENDDDLSKTGLNIGQFEDGILNGQPNKNGQKIMTGYEFINFPDDLQDVDGKDGANDPGWIHLYQVEVKYDKIKDEYSYPEKYDEIGPLVPSNAVIQISDFLRITFTWNKNNTGIGWELWTDPDKKLLLLALLGQPSFDHLAFSLKAGNAFAVYDFDFNKIINGVIGDPKYPGESLLDFETAYTFGGTFNTGDFLNNNEVPQAISHINVWARDPAADNVVPEPATMALMGMGLLALAGIGRKRYKKE